MRTSAVAGPNVLAGVPRAKRRFGSLRGRVQASIVTVTALAVLLFAIPLGIVIRNFYQGEAITALQRDATRVAAVVPELVVADTSAVWLPEDLPADLTVGIYDTTGRLISQHGPPTSSLAASARDGRMHEFMGDGVLAVSAPVPADQTISATVRVSIPIQAVLEPTVRAWVVMILLGVLVVAVAWLLARWQARRIAVPLEQLTESARALGAGDFTIHNSPSRIREADALAEALDSTARRLGALLDRERAFSTHVSHQLRTPLTALLLGLESALSRPGANLSQAARTALRRGEQLQNTIEDLLRLARDTHPHGDPLVVSELLTVIGDHWHGAFADQGRRLVFSDAAGLPDVTASATAVRHVLDVLVSNALLHGAGDTEVSVGELGGGLVIEVTDQGAGVIDPDGAFAPRADRAHTHGIGLALARSLAEAEGGRLLLRRASPHPVFSLLLPGHGPVDVDGDPGDARSSPRTVSVAPPGHPAIHAESVRQTG